ncbi:PIN domain-containing protein [Candidatus Woesearchaeota archaeon]|nr:PIN domain-containing protein [Candidatus Woesearchaeota archaeon]
MIRLVIDTSSIISALIKNGISRKIIVNPVIQLVTPDHSLKEISKYKNLICKKAKINANEFNIIFNLLFEKITIIPKEEYEEFFDAAKTLIDDINDVPFIALCLALKADGIWSDDTHFKPSKEITIYRTRELALAFKPRKK